MIKEYVKTLSAFPLFLTLLAPRAYAYHAVPKDDSQKATSVSRDKRTVCHRDLMFEGVELYLECNKGAKTSKDLKEEEIVLAIVQGSIDEDATVGDDRTFRVLEHFYNPDRPADKDGIEFSPFTDGSEDALKRAEKIWKNAITLYKQGQKKEAYYELGRVMHLFQDMAVPEHVYLIYHGPDLEKFSILDFFVRGKELLSQLFSTEDTNKCTIIEGPSPFEDVCSKTSIGTVLERKEIKIIPTPGMAQAFKDMANASLKPEKDMADIFKKNYRIVDTGNGTKVGDLAGEDCRKIAKYLVPKLLGRQAGIIELWEKEIAEETLKK